MKGLGFMEEEIGRKAFFNLLFISAFDGPSSPLGEWAEEDYRVLDESTILHRLKDLEISLNKDHFLNLVEEFEGPEDLTDHLTSHFEDPKPVDQAFLLIFELWRRWAHEKPTLSIFCDDLDRLIFLYDQGGFGHAEALQDALATLGGLLDDSVDQGAEKEEVFNFIKYNCANDIESFLFDFISEQLEADNLPYASELVDIFKDYASDKDWFELLDLKLRVQEEPESTTKEVTKFLHSLQDDMPLEFFFELLMVLIEAGDRNLFIALVRQALPSLETEEDLQTLLSLSADFFNRLDDPREEQLAEILKKREHFDSNTPLDRLDEDVSVLLRLMDSN